MKGVLCISGKDLPRKVAFFVNKIKILVHAQDSCACTTLLCVHITLVHAFEGPGPEAGTQNKKQPRVRPGAAAFAYSQ